MARKINQRQQEQTPEPAEAVERAGDDTPPPAVRANIPHLIQVEFDSGFSDLIVQGDTREFADTAAALKYIRDRRLEGKFRIVAVKRLVTAELEQVSKLKLT